MPETNNLGASQAAAIINAGMAIRIYQDYFTGANQGRQHGQIGDISGGKYDGTLTIEIFRQLPFEGQMTGKCSVGHPWSCGAGAFFADGIASRIDTIGIKW